MQAPFIRCIDAGGRQGLRGCRKPSWQTSWSLLALWWLWFRWWKAELTASWCHCKSDWTSWLIPRRGGHNASGSQYWRSHQGQCLGGWCWDWHERSSSYRDLFDLVYRWFQPTLFGPRGLTYLLGGLLGWGASGQDKWLWAELCGRWWWHCSH